jgi:hypothetical protein
MDGTGLSVNSVMYDVFLATRASNSNRVLKTRKNTRTLVPLLGPPYPSGRCRWTPSQPHVPHQPASLLLEPRRFVVVVPADSKKEKARRGDLGERHCICMRACCLRPNGMPLHDKHTHTPRAEILQRRSGWLAACVSLGVYARLLVSMGWFGCSFFFALRRPPCRLLSFLLTHLPPGPAQAGWGPPGPVGVGSVFSLFVERWESIILGCLGCRGFRVPLSCW